MAVKAKNQQCGELPPQYGFILNPYPRYAPFTLPLLRTESGSTENPPADPRKPMHFIALNYTCRYCQSCDLLMAHKDEIEHLWFVSNILG
jgi:hypothetical protein